MNINSAMITYAVWIIWSIVLVVSLLLKIEKLKRKNTELQMLSSKYRWFVDELLSEVGADSNRQLLIVEDKNIENQLIEDKIIILKKNAILAHITLKNSVVLFHPESTNCTVMCVVHKE